MNQGRQPSTLRRCGIRPVAYFVSWIARAKRLTGQIAEWERLITEKRRRGADLISGQVDQKSKKTATNPKGSRRSARSVSAAARDLGISRDAVARAKRVDAIVRVANQQSFDREL